MIRILLLIVTLLVGQTVLANVVGSDLQNFNATTSGIDYVTVHSTEPLEPGIFNTGLMFNYAVNSLPFYKDESGTQNRIEANDSLLMGEFNFGLGLPGDWELGLSSSYLFRQKIDNEDLPHSRFIGTGWTNARFNVKKKFVQREPIGMGIMLTANRNNVRRNPFLGENNRGIYSAELLVDAEFIGIVAAVNVGYRWRKDAPKIPTSEIEPTPDQYIASVGASYRLPIMDMKLLAEVFGSRPAEGIKTNTARQASSMEAILGIKYDYSSEISLHAGGGTELLHGQFSPDWRLYTGINYSVGPVFKQSAEMETHLESAAKRVKVVMRSTHFNFNSDDLAPEAVQFLQEVAADLEKFAVESVSVEGHTDSVGAESYNQVLSLKRATTVKENLMRFLRKPIEINIVGHGESQPIASNNNFQGRQKNRRVEIIYYKK